MFKFLLLCAVVGIALASPVSQPRRPPHPVSHPAPQPKLIPVPHHVSGDDVHAETLQRSDDVRADGFEASLETSNHISEKRDGDEHGNIHGDFGWISPEGEHIQLTYVADEHGYQPHGDHLPTSPPIPEAIQRSLDWIAAHPPAPEYASH